MRVFSWFLAISCLLGTVSCEEGEAQLDRNSAVKRIVNKAIEDLQYTLEEDFGSFGRDIVKVGKRVAGLSDEVKVVLGMVVLVVLGVISISLIITWQHFKFLLCPCIWIASCMMDLGCRALCACCKLGCSALCSALCSCCKGGSKDLDDLEAQRLELEAKIKDLEAQAENKSTDLEAQNKS